MTMQDILGSAPFNIEFTSEDSSDWTASDIVYDNTASGLQVANVQQAIDKNAENILNKQPKLRGSAGQVVGFGADGAAVAVAGWSNPNLLDNWYFQDPINQRGQTEYMSVGYTIDLWSIETGAKLKVLEDGVVFTPNPSKYSLFAQCIENYKELIGKQLTLSVLIEENTCTNCVLWFYGGTTDNFVYVTMNGSDKLYSVTMTPNSNIISLRYGMQGRNTSGSVMIKAIKLELGSQQTLAHQDAAGNWVLNDPPPDKTLEMLKCQRYYQVFSSADMRPVKAVDFRPPMRVDPALSTIQINGVTYYTADANL